MARALLLAVFLPGLRTVLSLNLTAGDGDSRLLRREDSRAKLWEEMVEEATGEQATPTFQPDVHQCNYRKAVALQSTQPLQRRSATQRALKEVKNILADHNVPVILIGGLARGYHDTCTAAVDNMDRVVATFGPWLEEAGLKGLARAFQKRGHQLDMEDCKAGPLNAGCKLSAHLFHDGPSIDIQVLFSAPPAAVARPPGRFSRCATICGKHCENCALAYPKFTETSRSQDRFFPCPIPIRSFTLAAWMNDTFWVPKDMETYIEAEYGSTSKLPHEACSNESLSSFETLVTLPTGSQVMQMQRKAGGAEAMRIATAAGRDRDIWRKYFTKDEMSRSPSPWAFRPTVSAAAASKSSRFRVLLLRLEWLNSLKLQHLLLFTGIALSLAAAYVVPKRLSACSMRVVEVMLGRHTDSGMFSIYMAIILSATFSQHWASVSGLFALAATILWQFSQVLCLAGLVWLREGWRGLLLVVNVPRQSVGGSAWLLGLTTTLGCCTAVSHWLSFISLSWLDPVSYITLVQVSLLLAEIAGSRERRFGREHVLALAVVILIFSVQSYKAAAEQDLMLYRGLVSVLVQVLLSAIVLLCKPVVQEASISRDVLVLAQSMQGLMILLAIFLCCGHSTLGENLSQVLKSQWALISIALLLLSNIVHSECLPTSTPIEELCLCGLILKTVCLQWFILGGGDTYDLQTVFLGLLALVVCLAEHMASQPLPDPGKTPKSALKKPTLAAQKALAAPKKFLGRPPRPPAKAVPTGRKESDLGSEVSTTAPSTPRGSTSLAPHAHRLQNASHKSHHESSSSESSSDWTSDSE